MTDDDSETESGSDEQAMSREEKMREMQGGQGSPGGIRGGNPMAEMMGGGGGPPGMGAGGGGQGGIGSEELVREVEQLREEVHDIRRTLERIADELE